MAAAETETELQHGSSPWRRFRRHRMAQLGVLILVAQILFVTVGPMLSPMDALKQNLFARYGAPDSVHWMGTDELGRDLMVRVMLGGRVSMVVGLCAMAFALAVGTLLGAIAGYYPRMDGIIMRVTDMMLSFPSIIVLILLASVFGTGFWTIVVVVGALRWMSIARIIRASFLSLREREYVEAARATGAGGFRIVLKHMLPNTMGPIIVNCTLGVASAILTESTLSFLGFGIQPPTPTWGNMLQNAQSEMFDAPWMAIYPGLAILLAVMSINFIGDGLRDAFDPRANTRG